MDRDVLDEHRLRRLIDVGRGLVAQLDLEAVLSEVVAVGRELTGARYAALGILDEDGRERFTHGETDRSRVLETIAKRARTLVGARSLLVLLHDGNSSEVVAAAGECGAAPVGRYVTVEAAGAEAGLAAARRIGIDAGAASLAPLDFRGRTLGTIIALDRLEEGPRFHPEDERLLAAAATSAAAAVATVQSVTEDRLRQNLMAAERERARWARELHDSVLQGMGSRRLLLSSALKSGDPERLTGAVEEGLRDVGRDIDDLRGLITELRPATLDQLGLVAALEDLAERVRTAPRSSSQPTCGLMRGALTPSSKRSSTGSCRRP